MSNAPTLYYMVESGPCRTVLMTAKLLGLDLNLKLVDLLKGEHLSTEFLKMNPQHKLPTLVDGDLNLGESRAIITYLVDKYGKDDSLYPKDVKERAKVDSKLYFDLGTLYAPIVNYYRVIFYERTKTYAEKEMPNILKAFEVLDKFLDKSTFVAGETLTLADVAIVSSIATAIAVFDFDIKPYPNVCKWFKLMKSTLPDYNGIIEENGKKLRTFVENARDSI